MLGHEAKQDTVLFSSRYLHLLKILGCSVHLALGVVPKMRWAR
ncbi:hypothetical protein S1OALGB6SA_23 [Olavius algarvensis spirochete endosymbiont]|nr:hypothetical protein S1OALGB6SA_23 [Olavius algarvensis spirochete endosymbiont]